MVSVCVLLLQLQPGSTFHTHHEIGSRIQLKWGDVLASYTKGEVAPENELHLDPEVIQLKDDLIALASATRRGVSRTALSHTSMSNIHQHHEITHLFFIFLVLIVFSIQV